MNSGLPVVAVAGEVSCDSRVYFSFVNIWPIHYCPAQNLPAWQTVSQQKQDWTQHM